MTAEDQIRDEKPQYDTDREAANISALLSGKIDKTIEDQGEKQIKAINDGKNN